MRYAQSVRVQDFSVSVSHITRSSHLPLSPSLSLGSATSIALFCLFRLKGADRRDKVLSVVLLLEFASACRMLDVESGCVYRPLTAGVYIKPWK